MIDYELSVNIKTENKEAIETLLITVESKSAKKADTNQDNIDQINIGAVELLSISGLSLSNKAEKGFIREYELDPWLSPLSIEKEL